MSEELLRLSNEIDNPPSCFCWVIKEIGVRVPVAGVLTLRQCVERAGEVYRANKLKAPENLKELIVDYCCRRTTVGRCNGDTRPIPLPNAIAGSSIDQVVTGTKALASWLLQGKESEEVAERRAAVCLSCPYQKDIKAGCAKCKQGALNRLKSFVTTTLQGDAKPWESGLGACEVCGCSLRLKIRTLHSVIKTNMPPAQLQALPPSCWIITEDKQDA